MAGGIPGIPLALAGTGAVLVYSGIENQTITAILKSLSSGKKPTPGQPGNYVTQGPVTPVNGGAIGTGGSATGQAIATDALVYQGHAYDFGGAPGTSGTSPWDCSSFVNWVIGHDMKMAIPEFSGGSYTGAVHGPSSFTWAAWAGCTTVGSSPDAALPGDVCIWMNAVGHIGISIGGGKMISALDPGDGTKVTPISGTDTGLFMVRRLKATIETGTGGGKRN